jgi:hypothetical protein
LLKIASDRANNIRVARRAGRNNAGERNATRCEGGAVKISQTFVTQVRQRATPFAA